MTITNKQARFVAEYLVDFNATQAAIRAGYSKSTAYSQGSRLLRNVEIMDSIREQVMGADEVLIRMTDIARGDIADLMDITPAGFTFRLVNEKDGERVVNPNTKLIKKIKQKVTTVLGKKQDDEDREIIETEIELYNAQEALNTLGKHHKLFSERTELTDGDGKPLFSGLADVATALVKTYGDKK